MGINETIEELKVQIWPVDRSKQELSNGKPVTEDHREIDPVTGLQKGYVVLSPEERRRGFVRPLRFEYIHLECGSSTVMNTPIAETFARDPTFYSGTFCSVCRRHFSLDQFVWKGTGDHVGS